MAKAKPIETTNVPSKLQNWSQLVRGNVTPCAADIRLGRKAQALWHIAEMEEAVAQLRAMAEAIK